MKAHNDCRRKEGHAVDADRLKEMGGGQRHDEWVLWGTENVFLAEGFEVRPDLCISLLDKSQDCVESSVCEFGQRQSVAVAAIAVGLVFRSLCRFENPLLVQDLISSRECCTRVP